MGRRRSHTHTPCAFRTSILGIRRRARRQTYDTQLIQSRKHPHKKGEGYTFTGKVYSGVECGQSTGATYPCLMLSRTRLKRVNILSGAFTIHLGTFYTSDGWDDSLPGSCQTVPEYMYINFLLLFDRKPRGKWRQWRFGEAKKEAKIGFAAAQMTRRKEERRQTEGVEEEKSNRKLGSSVQSLVGNKTFEESRVS